MQILRLLRTVCHLHPRQIAGQIRARLQRQFGNPARVLSWPVPDWPGLRWEPRVPWLAPGPQLNTQERITAGELTFLSETRQAGWPVDWEAAHASKLWQYNLHYLEYLWALDYAAARQLATHWIAAHGPERRRVGWESYPISLRLMNMTAVFFGRFRQQTQADDTLRLLLWRSIVQQAGWLATHLETHLMGNHLLENGLALAMIGSAFEGDLARQWREQGMALLNRELAEQILPDGCHFERSPMYQLRLSYGLTMVLNTGDRQFFRLFADKLRRMVAAVDVLRHPDGEIALLNDSAFDIYNTPSEVIQFAAAVLGQNLVAAPRSTTFALPDAGYFGVRTDTGNYAICDAGPIGPDYLPGHAHGDMLAFEISFAGQRVAVDSGNFDYIASEMRAYCRSTAAHNTVTINGQDQCEFWSAFRVGRRSRPQEVRFRPDRVGFSLDGWHDAYRHLPGRPIHHRYFRWYHEGVMLIRDQVAADQAIKAVSRLHLHPDCEVTSLGERSATVTCQGLDCLVYISFAGQGQLETDRAWFCPRFGQRQEATVLCWVPAPGAGEWATALTSLGPIDQLNIASGMIIHGRQFGW